MVRAEEVLRPSEFAPVDEGGGSAAHRPDGLLGLDPSAGFDDFDEDHSIPVPPEVWKKVQEELNRGLPSHPPPLPPPPPPRRLPLQTPPPTYTGGYEEPPEVAIAIQPRAAPTDLTEDRSGAEAMEGASGRRDVDFETMKDYDKRAAGEPQRTLSWRMAVVMVAVGFITSGVAAVTVYWRRRGCLLYKLVVLEGTEAGCCIPMDFRVVDYLGASRDLQEAPFSPYHASEIVPSPVAPTRCTHLHQWESGDAKTAHAIALVLVIIALLMRFGAVGCFIIGRQYRRFFPILTLCCCCTGFLCIVGYVITWNEGGVRIGPAVGFVGAQVLLDTIAFFSTRSSGQLDERGRITPKVKTAMKGWHRLPRRVKVVYGFFLLGWVISGLGLFTHWRKSAECSQSKGLSNIHINMVSPPRVYGDVCCTKYYLLFSQSDCGDSESIFSWTSRKEQIATGTTLLFAIAATGFEGVGTWMGWNNPLLFPRYGLITGWLWVGAVLIYGTIWSRGDGTRYSNTYVIIICYTAFNVVMLSWLYKKYHSQLLSESFHHRRAQPELEAKGQKAERPILMSKPHTRRIKMMGTTYIRNELATVATKRTLSPKTPPKRFGTPVQSSAPEGKRRKSRVHFEPSEKSLLSLGRYPVGSRGNPPSAPGQQGPPAPPEFMLPPPPSDLAAEGAGVAGSGEDPSPPPASPRRPPSPLRYHHPANRCRSSGIDIDWSEARQTLSYPNARGEPVNPIDLEFRRT